MISMQQSRDLIAHLSAIESTHVIYPDDPARAVAQALLDAAGRAFPLLRSVADQIAVRTARTSVTIPAPGGCFVVLSPMAVKEPKDLATTGAHEHQHAHRENGVGATQTVVDYLEPELRAQREAESYSVGMAVDWFLTGVIPTVDDAILSLKGETYMLPASELELARGILESALASMESGCCPPIATAVNVLAWLRAKHPELILATVA